MSESLKYKTGDLVWAKMRGYRPWPGKVINPPDSTERRNERYIYFYGSHNTAFINKKNMWIYSTENVSTFTGKSPTGSFKRSLQEIAEDYKTKFLCHDEYNNRNKAKLIDLDKTELVNSPVYESSSSDSDCDLPISNLRKKIRISESLSHKKYNRSKAKLVVKFRGMDKTKVSKSPVYELSSSDSDDGISISDLKHKLKISGLDSISISIYETEQIRKICPNELIVKIPKLGESELSAKTVSYVGEIKQPDPEHSVPKYLSVSKILRGEAIPPKTSCAGFSVGEVRQSSEHPVPECIECVTID